MSDFISSLLGNHIISQSEWNEYLIHKDGQLLWKKIWHSNALKKENINELMQLYFHLSVDDNGNMKFPLFDAPKEVIENSNLYHLMKKIGKKSIAEIQQWSFVSKELFWKETIENLGIVFSENPQEIIKNKLSPENPQWLYGAKLNIVESCFQNKNDIAVIYSDEQHQIKNISYEELGNLVQKIAWNLSRLGVKKGDRIAIYMPMTYECVAIYLGIIACGAVAVPIADSFSASEIETRIILTNPKYIFIYDEFTRLGKKIDFYQKIREAKAPPAILLSQIGSSHVSRELDMTWEAFCAENQSFLPIPMNPTDDCTILFSSGTTGEPKGIPWSHTTPIKCASDAYYHHDIKPNDVICWPTNLGWMMGPWLIYASLINQATIALYYNAPTDHSFGSFVEKAKVTMLGTIPSIVKNWRQSKAMEKNDWSSIRAFSSTGECSNAEDIFYLSYLAGFKPVIEYCGGTEIAGGYISNAVTNDFYCSIFQMPAMGLQFYLYDGARESNLGEVFLAGPSIGFSERLINKTKSHSDTYYDAEVPIRSDGIVLRRHGDEIEKVSYGYKAHGRSDDSMNLGGIKVSSVQIEEILMGLEDLKECAAVAISPKGGGPSELVIFAVLLSENQSAEELLINMQKLIRTKLNPLFKISAVQLIRALPRTASNKVMRKELRKTYELNTRTGND